MPFFCFLCDLFIYLSRFYDLLWKVSQHALSLAMQKEFGDYDMPHLATFDAGTSLQKVVDMINATKVHFNNICLVC